ncbi:hypothetical protein GGE07_006080 [Sinorhizobium terangae]|nr:hypothetical protein [Sinorhizobium terangae]
MSNPTPVPKLFPLGKLEQSKNIYFDNHPNSWLIGTFGLAQLNFESQGSPPTA